jgi:macrolide transport system ATP-binding/permease protein
MKLTGSLRSFAAVLFRRARVEDEMDEELRAHVKNRARDLEGSGLSRSEAERRARMEFGGYQKFKEDCREAAGVHIFETIVQDIRYALRGLRRSPGFSVLVVLCLTLGIGANAAVWSWIEGLLIRPFPAVAHQERMYALVSFVPGGAYDPDVSWPDFLDLQRTCKLVESFIADEITEASLSMGSRAEDATGSIVSANYFDALGVRTILGRGFQPGEDVGRNAHPVVVISYQMWQNRFKGDPAIIGKTQSFNRVQFTIIGIAPKGFYGIFVGRAIQFWVPASMKPVFAGKNVLDDRSARWIEGFVKLKPGVTREQAQGEVSAVAARLASIYPEADRGRDVQILPLWLTPFNWAGELRPALQIMLAAVIFVLLIACANVGNLLLVRFFARRHEIILRLALGAARRRLVRQLLTEGLIFSVFGGIGGVLVARWCRDALVLFFPRTGTIPHLPGEIDGRVLALSIGVCVLSTLLFALIPAIQASKIDLAGALKSEMGGLVSSQSRSRLRSSLVLMQIALSFVLIVGGVLLLQSLRQMQNTTPGFSTRNVFVTYVDLSGSGYDAQRAEDFEKQLIARLQTAPGIDSAAFAGFVPLDVGAIADRVPIAVDGYVPPPNEQPTVEYTQVSPGYFATVGIPLISGREFTAADDKTGTPFAVVNEKMASQFWRGKSPIGQRLQFAGRSVRVIGVAKTSKYDYPSEAAQPFFFVPLRQNPSPSANLFIRTSMPAQTVDSILSNDLRAMDPGLADYAVITMQEELDRSTSYQTASVGLLFVLGALALILAIVGLYGVVAYAVSQSRRELGLRMALGAHSASLLWHVLSRGLALTVGGVAIGAIASLSLTRLAARMLYQVSPRDPLAFGLAFIIMMCASMAACFIPAWRASRTDPMVALRYE